MPPRVLIIAGSPASGKTTLAGYACRALGGATLVDKDTLEWPLANAALVATGHAAHDHGCSLYTDVLKAAAYETMERVAEQAVKAAGANVVLVAPFTSHSQDPTWLKRLQTRLSPVNGPLVDVSLVWVTAAPDVLNARKAARGDGRDTIELQAIASAKAKDATTTSTTENTETVVVVAAAAAAANDNDTANGEIDFTLAEAKRQKAVPAHVHTWVDTSNIQDGAEMQSLAEWLVAGELPVSPPKTVSPKAPAVDVILVSNGDGGSSRNAGKVANNAGDFSAICSDTRGASSGKNSTIASSSSNKNNDMVRVLCAGHACMDVVLENCDELETREGYASVEKFGLRPGGAVSNVAMQLAALAGTRSGVAENGALSAAATSKPVFAVDACTTIGRDGLGTLLLEAWRSAGVGIDRFVKVDPRHATGAACLPVYRRDGKRAVYCAQGWNAHLSPEQLLMQTTATTSTPTMSTSTAAAAVTVAVSSDYASAAGLVLSVRQSQIKLAAALGAYHCLTLGYPHVMPGLQGESLRALCRACVEAQCCLALDVNEASDDASLPLGTGSWDDDNEDYVDSSDSNSKTGTTTSPSGGVSLLHANLDEAAGCLGMRAQLWARASSRSRIEEASSLEQVVTLSQVADVAQQLLKRGASVVLITLGANGAYGAVTSDETKLRQRLGKMCPKDVSGLLGACGRVNAFQVHGTVDSVGAGDSFLAGIVAALLWHSKQDEEVKSPETIRPETGTADFASNASSTVLTLTHVLEFGLASALYKVDTAKEGPAPSLTDLAIQIPVLPRLEPPNVSLCCE